MQSGWLPVPPNDGRTGKRTTDHSNTYKGKPDGYSTGGIYHLTSKPYFSYKKIKTGSIQ